MDDSVKCVHRIYPINFSNVIRFFGLLERVCASAPSFTNEATLLSPRHVHIDFNGIFNKTEGLLLEIVSDNKNRIPLVLRTGFDIRVVAARAWAATRRILNPVCIARGMESSVR